MTIDLCVTISPPRDEAGLPFGLAFASPLGGEAGAKAIVFCGIGDG